MTKHLILDSQLQHLAHGDVNTACREIQKMLGVENGDVAGMLFSTFDWANASIERRMQQLRQYVRAELAYARDYDPQMNPTDDAEFGMSP